MPARDQVRIPCKKCGARNEPDRNRCRSCGSHLYLLCKYCGEKVARFIEACPTCNQPLHQGSKKSGKSGLVEKLQSRMSQIVFYLILLAFLAYLFSILDS